MKTIQNNLSNILVFLFNIGITTILITIIHYLTKLI